MPTPGNAVSLAITVRPALALAHELVDDTFGRADAHEAADHQAGVVRNERYRVGEWESSHRDASLK
jgi:hypothetical protein